MAKSPDDAQTAHKRVRARTSGLPDELARFVDDERLHWLPSPLHSDVLDPQNAETGTAVRSMPELERRPAAVVADTSGNHITSATVALGRRLADWVGAEYASQTPFVLAPVAMGTGAVAYYTLMREPEMYQLINGLVLSIGVLILVLRKSIQVWPRLAAWALMLTILGAAVAKFHTDRMDTSMLGSSVTTRIFGVIEAHEVRDDGSVRLTIALQSTHRPTLRHSPTRIRVTARKLEFDKGGLGRADIVGRIVKGRVRLSPPSMPFRPSGYDFAFMSYFQGIGANGFFLGAARVSEPAPTAGWLDHIRRVVAQMRGTLGERIVRLAPDSAGLAVSAALVTGDRGRIPEAVADALRASGLAHILAISGLHMALVAGTVMFVLRGGLALFPDVAARNPTKKFAAFGAVIIATLYLVLSGGSVATQRAWVMLAIMLLAVLMDRSALTMRNLALAALVILAIAPHEVMGPSFQMSFAATGALIAVYQSRIGRFASGSGLMERGMQAQGLAGLVLRGSLAFVGTLVLTAIVAGVATGLFSVSHFNRVAPLGLIANVLAVPIVSLAVMPLGLLGVLLLPFGLDGFAFAAMGKAVDWVIAVAEHVVALSPSGAAGDLSTGALILCVAALIGVCCLRTPLRFVALLLLIPALFSQVVRDRPVALVSSDAQQFSVLVPMADGSNGLAVNRSRPNAFTLDQWMPWMGVDTVIKPVGLNERAEPLGAMRCGDAFCVGSMSLEQAEQTRQTILYLSKPMANDVMVEACRDHLLIIHAYSPAQRVCAEQSTGRSTAGGHGQISDLAQELTAQDLALHGTVAIYRHKASDGNAKPRLILRHAVGDSQRPWNIDRKWSRAARNLAEWKPD